MSGIPFETTDWQGVEAQEVPGLTGTSHWRSRTFGDINVHLAEYSPGYAADHWCEKGHILLVLEGTLHTRLADGREFVLTPGMTYQVEDGSTPHRSSTQTGVRLFIVD